MAEQPQLTKVDLLDQSYNSALRVSETERKEQKKMHNFFTGKSKGQWSLEGKALLQSRGSMVPQVNLVKPKIRKLAGSAVKNFFHIAFTPVNTKETPLTRTANDVFVSDTNMMKYDLSYFDCVLDALIHVGVQQMKLTTRFNPLGNITFETLQPGHVIIDPNWKTKDSWDIKEVWKVAYLTPNEIIATYGHRNARITQLLNEIKLNGLQYDMGQEDPSMSYQNLNSSYGSKYRIIEHHYLEVTSKVVKFARVKDGGEDIDVSNMDPDQLENLRNDQNSNVESVISRRVQHKVYHIQSSCKELDPVKLLEDGVSDIQIGRLPFFPLAADRQGGVNSGIVESLVDVQTLLNSREARVDDQIAASGGALLVDPMIVGGDDGKAQQLLSALNRPDAKVLTQTGMLASGRQLVQEIKKPAYAGELFQDIQRLAGYMDTLSGQTATLDGEKESAHDTGVLFSRRAVQAEIALTHLTQNLERFRRDEAEAWLLYAKHVYSGAFREIKKTNSKGEEEIITLNHRTYDEDGNIYVNDDLSTLPRHNVIISQSKDGLLTKEVDRSRNVELMNYVTGPIKRAILEQNALETLDNSVEDKAELRKYGDLELAVIVASQEAQLAQLKQQTLQAEQATAQMQQQTAQVALGGVPGEEGQEGGEPQGEPGQGQPAQVPQQTDQADEAQ